MANQPRSVTALIIVDVQNDFADPAGALYVRGAEDAIAVINELAAQVRSAGASVVASQDWHPARTPHFTTDGGIWPVHCVAGTWGAELHPALAVDVADWRVRKGVAGEDGYSAFSARRADGTVISTGLHEQLQTRGISRVLVCGLATDYCVKATALDAVALGYDVVLLTDAIAAVELAEGDGQRALAEMAAAGVRLDVAGRRR
jgi:nicotinamidase/pyrazinamidase